MPCLVQIDDRGIATLEIEAAGGEVNSYRLTAMRPGLGVAAYLIERLDTQETYRLSQDRPGGRWRCTCPSHRYRQGSHTDAGCKHTDAVGPVHRFLESLKHPESTHERPRLPQQQ